MRVVLLSLFLAFGAAQTPAPVPTGGVIEGRVLRTGTTDPLYNMPVTLIASGGLSEEATATLLDQIAALVFGGLQSVGNQDGVNTAVTNLLRAAGAGVGVQQSMLTSRDGRFSFKDVAPGRYIIWAQRLGYFGPSFNGTPAVTVWEPVVSDGRQSAAPATLYMTPGAVIAGRVLDPTGQPLANAQVSAFAPAYTDGRAVWRPILTRVTDDRGEYRLAWVGSGDYYVGVTPNSRGPLAGPQDAWMRTFFPGVTEPALATRLTLQSGATENINLSIRVGPVGGFNISGTAINLGALPHPTTGLIDRSISGFVLAPAEFSLLDSVNPPVIQNAISQAARQNGEFEIRNVRPGVYDIYPILSPTGVVAGHARVDLRATHAQGVRLAFNAPVSIPGQVTVAAGSQPWKLESMRIGLRLAGNAPAPRSDTAGVVPVDATGKFTLAPIAGELYSFAVTGLPDTAYVADIRQGQASVFDSGLNASGAPEPIQIVVDGARGGTVEGTVQSADRKPVARAMVVLIPPEGQRQNALRYKTKVADSAGRFTMRGVPPGSYKVLAWESVPQTAWLNAEFMAKYRNRGQTIEIAPSGRAQLQLEAEVNP